MQCSLTALGILVEVDLAVGHLTRFEVERDGRRAAPFHRAPWANDPEPIDGTEGEPYLSHLSGDFFCAPFAAADVEAAPAHGWTASATWAPIAVRTLAEGGMSATFVLERRVMGARVLKELQLRDNHPFLYQRHVFEGGTGALPVAHHTMVRLPNAGQVSFSPKRWAETPAMPLESDPTRGRSILAYPARSSDLGRFPRADGGTADLRVYPIDESHEDFAMLLEAAGSELGWSAVVRTAERDMALVLKNPAQLPVTMLWYSNGGRTYAPWSGRHRGVLGIEDGCSWSLNGHAASIATNPLTEIGVPTSVSLDPAGRIEVRQIIGAIPTPPGWEAVHDLTMQTDALTITDASGHQISLPFDSRFLREVS
ncbi:hypothetical protein AA309_12985 [Microvirga vignae]|uniref:Uncharacterized protein n=1 Tax=Microvirga vignae TaxID=1225564 RepID=A0A0H1RCF9_9HYPH|nr:hypothetical protein AA309_12985 [Microvirga vignae]